LLMFHTIPAKVQERMHFLERIDAQDRIDGTPFVDRLRQIPAETGRFVALLAACAPEGLLMEIGTSAGYSALWLALAGRERGKRVFTFETLEAKVQLARETFRVAGVEDTVELIVGDARERLQSYHDVAFCFLDADKEVYADCYEAIVPNMVPGGILVADNAITHRVALKGMLDRASSDQRVDAMVLPIGRGQLVCRRTGLGS
jgi:caffeoyl-CoA O-methyltransferase